MRPTQMRPAARIALRRGAPGPARADAQAVVIRDFVIRRGAQSKPESRRGETSSSQVAPWSLRNNPPDRHIDRMTR